MATEQLSPLIKLRSSAIALSRSFQPVRPLVARSRIVSLNARCAITRAGLMAVPLQVVATELAKLGNSLGELIDDVEGRFGDVADAVAHLAGDEEKLMKYAEALKLLGEPISPLQVVGNALTPTAANDWTRRAKAYPPASMNAHLWNALVNERRSLLANLGALHLWARHIESKVTALQDSALNQGFFIGFNATMEAARLADAHNGLGAVADDITSYAQHMTIAVDGVARQVRVFTHSTAKVVKPVRSEIRQPAPTG